MVGECQARPGLTEQGTVERSKLGGEAWTVATCWVLGGTSQKSLSREMATRGTAVLDCLGFDGFAVCGSYYLHRLRDAHPELVGEVTPRARSELYRFGGGTGLAGHCAIINLMWRGERVQIQVDIVSGVLPLLLGRRFGARHQLVTDIGTGDVFTKVGNGLQLVARNDCHREG